jgi:Uncharacterized conserved protein
MTNLARRALLGRAATLAAVGLLPVAYAEKTHAAATGNKAGAAANSPIVKMPLADGVSADDAVQSMKLRANLLNMKLVGELPLSKQVQAITGKKQRTVGIYEFCDPVTAEKMVDQNIDFAAYLPCRITVAQDADGKLWLVMMNLAPLIDQVPESLRSNAIRVRDTLNSIMKAGATGAL